MFEIWLGLLLLVFISHSLIHYESSRGHKIDGTKPNQTGNTFGEEEKNRGSKQKKTDKKVASNTIWTNNGGIQESSLIYLCLLDVLACLFYY